MPGSNSKSIFSMDRWRKGGKDSSHANGSANGEYTAVDRSGDDEKHREANGDVDVVEENPEEEDKSRETWGSGVEFLLSTMGYAIGLGNVWRFPYMCYENGGGAFVVPYFVMLFIVSIHVHGDGSIWMKGIKVPQEPSKSAFLIPYFIMLFIVCFPIMFMEMGLGQFSSLGCISVWEISPFFKGIGYAMTLVSSYFCFYYIIIMAYSIFYLFASMQSELPWRGCNHTWNTLNCFEGSLSLNKTVNLSDPMSTAMPDASERVWATEEYWKYYVLDQTDGLHDMGVIRWQLLLCFIATWIIVYLCIIKGVKTSGKVVYFTATFPFLVLFILLIRGLTLDGAMQGVLYFIRPRFDKLLEAKVWLSAANQVFLSYGAGWGGILTLASYNKFKRNCLRDALIIVCAGSFTSILAGFVIFSVLGFMAHDAGVHIEDVVSSGPGLAFVAYPEALSRLPLPQAWSFLFFFMLMTLGLDSEFVTLETCITAFVDEFKDDYPILNKRRFFVVLGTCIGMLLIGLPLTMQGGVYVFELFNWYSAGFTPMLIVLFEVLAMFIYGGNRFMKDLSNMFGAVPIPYWWFFNWFIVTPIIIMVIMIFGFVDQVPAYYDDYIFPGWAQGIGWTLTMSSISCIFIYAIYIVIRQEGSLIQRMRAVVRSSDRWGPALAKNRAVAGYNPMPVRGTANIELTKFHEVA